MAAWARALAARSADELRERVDQAASRLERVGNAYHLATLFHNAAGTCAAQRRDGDATMYLQRAVPLVRQLDQPYQWMLLRGNVGLAALLAGDTEAARDAFREELTLSRELVVAARRVRSPDRPRRGRGGSTTTSSAPRGSRAPPRHIATANIDDSRSMPGSTRPFSSPHEPASEPTPGTPPSAKGPR